MSSDASNFVQDLLTVANNIGFDTTGTLGPQRYKWERNKPVIFSYYDLKTGNDCELMQVRAFKNGNLHIKFNQAFMCRLNVEFGRLKGWLKDRREAAEELDIPIEVAAESFGANLQLEIDNLPKLGFTSVTH